MAKYYRVDIIGVKGLIDSKPFPTKAKALKFFHSKSVAPSTSIYLEQRDTQVPHFSKRILWNSAKYGLKTYGKATKSKPQPKTFKLY